jgi:hypothetical protein
MATLEQNRRGSYAQYMTLSNRNTVFRLGIILAFLCLLICIFTSVKAMSVYAPMEQEVVRRSEGLFQILTGKWFATNLLAVHWCVTGLVLYSFLSLILIYFFFEKTQSPEILFVVFFAASFAPEALRLLLPLSRVYEIPSLYLLMASRVTLFGRYFGIFSLFTASIYTVGFKVQKQRNVILVIVVITLIITLGVPIDTETWDSGLNMISGYVSMFQLIEVGAFLFTTLSFFIAAWSYSSREFAFIGTGSALAIMGRHILLNADTWAALPTGLLLLVVGTWLICTKLHKIYLWL